MPKDNALFYLTEEEDCYVLSSSSGEGTWRIYGKEHFTIHRAINLADASIGEYVRLQCPDSIKFILNLRSTDD